MDNYNKCLKLFLIGEKYNKLKNNNKAINYFKSCINYANTVIDNSTSTDSSLDIEIIEEAKHKCYKNIINNIKENIDNCFNIITLNELEIDNIYTLIETGDIKTFIKNYKYDYNNFKYYKLGVTPLHYAIKCGDINFIKQLLILGGNIDITNIYGQTLLEYSCIEDDPSIISSIIYYGADIKKYIELKKYKQYINKGSEIDIVLLEIYIMEKYKISKIYEIKYLLWVFKFLNKDDKIDIEYIDNKKNISIYNIIESIDNILNNMEENLRNTFLSIIIEELEYDFKFNLGCPTNKLHIILYNIIPFIDYSNNFIINWLLIIEFKFIIFNIINNDSLYKNFKYNLKKTIYDTYLISEILSKGYIKILISQLFNKINI